NEDTIASVTSKASPAILWQGAFAQLSNSKVEANFADFRTYTYNGEPLDSAYHLGYDLSVTKRYPAEAANSGTVAFAGDLGIYGNIAPKLEGRSGEEIAAAQAKAPRAGARKRRR